MLAREHQLSTLQMRHHFSMEGAGWERRRREIVAEPYNFLFHVLRDENAATSDRVAAAIALMQHHRLADLDLTDGVGAAAQ